MTERVQQYSRIYARLHEASDRAEEMRRLDDDEVVGALAWATRERDGEQDHAVADALAAEALIRVRRRDDAIEALRLYRLLVERVVDYAIFALDTAGYVMTWNEGAQRLSGYASAEILGRHFSTLYTQEAREAGLPERLLKEAVSEGRVEDEGWQVRKDGSPHWALTTITAIHAEDGSLRGFGKVTRDLTDRRKADETLRAANEGLERRVAERTRELEEVVRRLRAANDSLEAFSFVVSHDLKEPVRGLIALLDVLREGQAGRLDAEGEDVLHRAVVTSGRLRQLVDDLLEWSRAGRVEGGAVPRVRMVEAFAAEATQARFEDAARERGATFEVILRADHVVRAPPAALSLILGNLVLNAIRHNPRPHPLVRVRSETREGPEGRREVEIVVEDDGPGFSEEARRRLNEPTAIDAVSVHGSGFGLAIVRRAIERLGGTLQMGDSPEGGAAVHVTLPSE